METELSNTVRAVGNYNNVPTSITSAVSVVTMISGLTITKTADKTVWADGNLTYSIVINNQAEKEQLYCITATKKEITDVLDSLIDFVPESVTIDGVQAETSSYSYNEGTKTLTINLDDITAGKSKTVTFQVKKKS